LGKIIAGSQRTSPIITLLSTITKEYAFGGQNVNIVQVRNFGSDALYVGTLSNMTSTANYEVMAVGSGTAIFTSPKGIGKIFLYPTGNATAIITSWKATDLTAVDLDRTLATVIINSVVSSGVIISASLPAGSALIGKVGIDQVTAHANEVVIKSAIPAGTNNIGDVDVLSLPALPAGSNNIGDVDVASLPALPAGGNNIGDVDVLSLPRIKTPVIYNVACTSADTEYSQALPSNTKRFSLSVQLGSVANNLRVAFATGKVATPTAPYFVIQESKEYYEDETDLASVTLYFASSNAGSVVQIIAWTE